MEERAKVRHAGTALLFVVLAGCSRGPDWVLVDKRVAFSSAYVDRDSLKKEGGLVRVTTRSVYEKEISTAAARKPFWSTVGTTLINCEARTWAEVKFEAFDKSGTSVDARSASPPFTFTSMADDWGHPKSLPRRLCEHLNNGAAFPEP